VTWRVGRRSVSRTVGTESYDSLLLIMGLGTPIGSARGQADRVPIGTVIETGHSVDRPCRAVQGESRPSTIVVGS